MRVALVAPHMFSLGGGQISNITSSLVDKAHSNVPSVLASLTKDGPQSATESLAAWWFASVRHRDREIRSDERWPNG